MTYEETNRQDLDQRMDYARKYLFVFWAKGDRPYFKDVWKRLHEHVRIDNCNSCDIYRPAIFLREEAAALSEQLNNSPPGNPSKHQELKFNLCIMNACYKLIASFKPTGWAKDQGIACRPDREEF